MYMYVHVRTCICTCITSGGAWRGETNTIFAEALFVTVSIAVGELEVQRLKIRQEMSCGRLLALLLLFAANSHAQNGGKLPGSFPAHTRMCRIHLLLCCAVEQYSYHGKFTWWYPFPNFVCHCEPIASWLRVQSPHSSK